MAAKEKKLQLGPFAAVMASGFIREPGTRRKLMLAAVLLAGAMALAGITFLRAVLDHHEHPFWFIFFWLGCAWVTALALLLALFDVLTVRAQARAARRVLKEGIARAPTPDSQRPPRGG
ncbi:MAG: hypothetical protein ACR2HH_08225 [Chthoniobacterales bacterium]